MSLLDDIKDFPESRWGAMIAPHHAKKLRLAAPQARQFIFDEEASRKLGRFIVDCPDIIADQLEFARPPYEPCYIEIDLTAMYKEMDKPTTALLYGPEEADWRLGYVVIGPMVMTLANNHYHQQARATMTGVIDLDLARKVAQLPTPLTSDQETEAGALLLGTTYTDLTAAQRRAFIRRFGMGYFGPDGREQEFARLFRAGAGEARTYAAALLLLYQQRHITIGSRPFERKIVGGKLRTFMAHHTVTIHLEKTEMRKGLGLGHHASPRRHEVRTHYAHRYGTRACEHDWHRIEDADNEQWRCSRCDRLRWLRKTYLRGDASKGFVTKHYEVQL